MPIFAKQKNFPLGTPKLFPSNQNPYHPIMYGIYYPLTPTPRMHNACSLPVNIPHPLKNSINPLQIFKDDHFLHPTSIPNHIPYHILNYILLTYPARPVT
jgi:hypothetical protein